MYIIEATLDGTKGWVREARSGFTLVTDMKLATRYATLIQAKVAMCYIEDKHCPTISFLFLSGGGGQSHYKPLKREGE